MNKHEKVITKAVKTIDKNVSVFSTIIEESDQAVEQFDETVTALREEIRERELLIAEALGERQNAINLRENVRNLIS